MVDEDEQYQKATKAVDNAMRTDVLGPKLCVVLRDHKPANDLVQKIVAEAITNSPEVQKKLGAFVANDSTTKRNKWIDRTVAVVVGAALVTALQYAADKL